MSCIRIKAALKAKGGQTHYYGVPNNPLGECICFTVNNQYCNLIWYRPLKSVLCQSLSPTEHSILCTRAKCQRAARQSM